MQENAGKSGALAREEIKAGFSHIKEGRKAAARHGRFNCALRLYHAAVICEAAEVVSHKNSEFDLSPHKSSDLLSQRGQMS